MSIDHEQDDDWLVLVIGSIDDGDFYNLMCYWLEILVTAREITKCARMFSNKALNLSAFTHPFYRPVFCFFFLFLQIQDVLCCKFRFGIMLENNTLHRSAPTPFLWCLTLNLFNTQIQVRNVAISSLCFLLCPLIQCVLGSGVYDHRSNSFFLKLCMIQLCSKRLWFYVLQIAACFLFKKAKVRTVVFLFGECLACRGS